MRINKLSSDDLDLYYDQTGDDTHYTIICLHGLASNATRWHEFLGNSKLSKHGQMLALDLRGHGRSMTHKAYSRSDWCNDLDNLITRINMPCILIGHSLGAQIALEYARLHGEKLDGIVLIDPVFPQALTGVLRKVAKLRLVIRFIVRILRLIKWFGIYRRQYPARDLYALDRQTREFLKNNPDKGIADLYMSPLADLKFMPLTNYLQDLIEVTRPLTALDRINIPTLVLLSQGASTSNVEINRKILSNITDCDIKAIASDHWLLTEKPIEAREAIDAWCSQHLKY